MRERILIAAGGTGGHLFPAEALSAALVARGHDTALITDRRTAARAGETFETVHVVASGGIVGKGVSARARGAAAIAAGTIAARRIVKREHPAVVVGFGGYPSVPPVLAARLLPFRPRIVLHDQNAVLGGANRLLARFADAVATSFDTVEGVPPGTRRVATGNPVRPAIAAIGPWQPPGERLEILVLGGSLGARVFSDVVPPALARLGRAVRVSQQARAEDVDRVRAAYAAAGIEAEISPFFADVADRLARAQLVISRAGGSTVAELAAAGRASILVPLPIAANDEQTGNARALVAVGAATLVQQNAFTPAWLATTLHGLTIETDTLARQSAAAKRISLPHGAENLADLVEELASNRYGTTRPIRERSPRNVKGIDMSTTRSDAG